LRRIQWLENAPLLARQRDAVKEYIQDARRPSAPCDVGLIALHQCRRRSIGAKFYIKVRTVILDGCE
jgi:hypothetical protein